ncbi:MAG TPA: SIMPL domain-containing protein [Ilumatobacteraceae bacterium]|jgi:uncharacterized protein YggE|nr:SIMPL domain-containing protein [Ilumatobacteraceae bacterium]
MSTRWKTALAAAGGAAVAAVAVIALSGRASEDADATVPPDSSVPAAPEGGERTITVNGHGTVTVVPDTADLSTGVQATADTATAALETVGSNSQDLVETLRGVGVAEDDIQTSGLSLWPAYGNDGRQITGYQASTSVTATIRDVAQVGAVVDALKGFVGDELTINGISFSYDDPEEVLAEARAAAIANATTRAEQYAAAAGVEVGAIVRIVEGSVSDPVVFARSAGAAEMAADAVAVAPGSQDLAADVTVVFAMA